MKQRSAPKRHPLDAAPKDGRAFWSWKTSGETADPTSNHAIHWNADASAFEQAGDVPQNRVELWGPLPQEWEPVQR
jgi:hypothetical protein